MSLSLNGFFFLQSDPIYIKKKTILIIDEVIWLVICHTKQVKQKQNKTNLPINSEKLVLHYFSMLKNPFGIKDLSNTL